MFFKFLLTLKYLAALIITTKNSCIVLNSLDFAVQTSTVTALEFIFLKASITKIMIARTRYYTYMDWDITDWAKLYSFILGLWI
jgi:hypothetical protein